MHQRKTSLQKSANREASHEPGYKGRKAEAVPMLYNDQNAARPVRLEQDQRRSNHEPREDTNGEQSGV
jgi:hypothetical protein